MNQKNQERYKIKNPNAPATYAQLNRIQNDVRLNCPAIKKLTKQQASDLISFYYNKMQRHPFKDHWAIGSALHECIAIEGIDALMELIKLPYEEVKKYEYKVERE